MEKELIEYIVIDTDAIKEYQVTPEKLAVHVAHVSDTYAYFCLTSGGRKTLERFLLWYDEGKFQKKVLLGANSKQIAKIMEQKHWTVTDIGCNQVPEGTRIALSLGIMTRDELKELPVAKRLQVFRYSL